MMNHGASGAYHAAIGSAQQGKALGDMISQTMGAHQDENDSRVAQMREMRRMEHEKELKRMELDALLARISQAQQPTGPQPKAVFRGGAIY
jgi:redox-regulated HSP33 family molecular chaperone